jgi:hypothetical protein
MDRDPNAKVSLTYRLPERLRSRLEASAKVTEASLNNEITRRLEQSFEREDNYLPQESSIIARVVISTLRAVEVGSGGRAWLEDEEMKAKTRAAIIAQLDILMPETAGNDGAEREGRAAAAEVYQEHAAKIIKERAPDQTPLTTEEILADVEAKSARRKRPANGS